MKPRRHHSHSRRQSGVVLSPGEGVLLDSGIHSVATEYTTDGHQQPLSVTLQSQLITAEHVQPAHHAIPSFDSQLSSIVESEEPVSSSFSATSTSVVSSVTPTTSASSTGYSHRSSSSLSEHSSSSSSRPSGSSTSAAIAVASNVNESSASASSAPTAAATAGHSAEFYGGIAFTAVAFLACLVAIVAFLIRSRRKGSMCRGSGGQDEDVENQDFGLGLGLYVDKPVSSPETSLANLPALPAYHGASDSPRSYPTTFTRPAAAHLPTDDSVRVPNRLLGPLRVRNYVSGDFPSSSDEAVPTPQGQLGSPREQCPGETPRYLGLEGQGLDVPWAPLNVKKSRAPNQVNIAHSATKKSEVAQAGGEEQNYTLPTPPFGFTQARGDREKGSPNGWRDTFSSSVHGALSGIHGSNLHSGGNISPAPHGSYPRSDRWRTVLSSQKAPVSEAVTSESGGGISVNPEVQTIACPLTQLGRDPITFETIGLCLKMGEQGDGGVASSMASTTPLAVSKKLGNKTQSKRHSGVVKPRTTSRTSSLYSPLFGANRRSTKRTPKFAKRTSVATQSSTTTRVRPEFLRKATADSVTSFSSETSEPSRALTAEELRAKRTLMLRAKRKRGMSNGTRADRPARRLTHTEQSPDAEPSVV